MTSRRRSVADEACGAPKTRPRALRSSARSWPIEQQIVLAVEVVIKVRGREIRRVGNVRIPVVGESTIPEQLGRGAEYDVPLAVAAAGAGRDWGVL